MFKGIKSIEQLLKKAETIHTEHGDKTFSGDKETPSHDIPDTNMSGSIGEGLDHTKIENEGGLNSFDRINNTNGNPAVTKEESEN